MRLAIEHEIRALICSANWPWIAEFVVSQRRARGGTARDHLILLAVFKAETAG
jgi:hypothetical protein